MKRSHFSDKKGTGTRKAAPVGLHRQGWITAGCLFIPWLLSVCLYGDRLRSERNLFLWLLPGLGIAVYLQAIFASHLGSNHRPGEDEFPFSTLGLANWITLLRAAAVVGLAGFLPFTWIGDRSFSSLLSWAPGTLYLGVSLADLLDGYVARKQGRETVLGKLLDIESDAAGILIASLVAVAWGRLPAFYLLVGSAYYFFRMGIRIRQKLGLSVNEMKPRPYARIIAGFQMGLVGVALMPIFDPTYTTIAALIFMTPLLTGFYHDWRAVSHSIKDQEDGNRPSTWVHRTGEWALKSLPWMLRLVIFSGGIATFAGFGACDAPPVWRAILGICCLFAAIGIMGRGASFLMALFFGSTSSPFGISVMSMVMFSAAAVLMLAGTGAMSLWAPEDEILYRRRKNSSSESAKPC